MTFATNQVGQTNLRVSSVSLGGSSFGNIGYEISDAEAISVMEHAWSRGIRYFDTAPHYGRGRSEARLGAWLAGKPREQIVLSSKVGRVLSPGPQLGEADGFINPLPNAVRYDYTADGILESFDGSCERLGTTEIEILFVHDIGVFTHGVEANAKHFDDLMGSGMRALHNLKQSGRVKAIGLGVNETQVCLDLMATEAPDVILLAGRLTLMDREAEDGLLQACADQGTSLVLGGIFNSGILATGPKPGVWFNYGPASDVILEKASRLQAHAADVGLTLAQAALQFAMRHPSACSVLIGTGKVSSLQRNLDAANLNLSDNALAFVST
ncbi:aldo/keto reductase [uncultured Ruegeria sp.]|uniref:aldo/keto reductase n=1 Tax=uncultured Ruegeria sp. TaxID=259304 RepID=UPI00262048DB|nr:aldo/keto reductase [uncultured Ruegeria sp.]